VLIIKLVSLIIIGAIAFQDFRLHAVYWIQFPILAGLLLFIRIFQMGNLSLWWQTATINIILISVQLLLVTAYFSWKKRRVVNLTDGFLHWGDIGFLLCITFYFSVASYMLYYIASLAVALLIWIAFKAISRTQTVNIPLAGLQAITLLLFLAADWGPHWIRLDDDTWFLNLISK
jgi:hypothetical protein